MVDDVKQFLAQAQQKIATVHKRLLAGDKTEGDELLQLYLEANQKLQELAACWKDNFETARTSADTTYTYAKAHYEQIGYSLHLFDNFKAMHEGLQAAPGAPPAGPKPPKTDDYWFRTAKIGDEYRGMHIAKIYDMGNEYILFSPVENPVHLNYYYADDTLGLRLRKIAVRLNALKTLLEGHPQRIKYLPAVAQVYALAFNDNIPAAEEAMAGIHRELTPGNSQEKKPPYIPIAAVGMLLGALFISVYLIWFRHESGPAALLTYLGLAFFGIGIAALVNAISGSSLSIKGTLKGVEYNFTGPIVAVILCVAGYFYFIRGDAGSKTGKTLTVRVFNNNTPVTTGQVKLYITGLNPEALPISNGQAIFSDIPGEKLQQKITIYATAPGYLALSIDTMMGELQDIKLNMVTAGQINISGRIADAGENPIANAIIRVKRGSDTADISSDGSYYLRVKNVTTSGPIFLVASAPGYEEKTVDVKPVAENITQNITLGKKAKVNRK